MAAMLRRAKRTRRRAGERLYARPETQPSTVTSILRWRSTTLRQAKKPILNRNMAGFGAKGRVCGTEGCSCCGAGAAARDCMAGV